MSALRALWQPAAWAVAGRAAAARAPMELVTTHRSRTWGPAAAGGRAALSAGAQRGVRVHVNIRFPDDTEKVPDVSCLSEPGASSCALAHAPSR
jgi:hypothetical protein